MRFLAVRGNPNLATPAKRHTGARHRAARATQRDLTHSALGLGGGSRLTGCSSRDG